MVSSGYYRHLMEEYKQKRDEVMLKKEKWEKYLQKLKNANKVLPLVNCLVDGALSNLLSGGYLIDEGVSLDNGKLKEISNTLEDDCSTLLDVISKCKMKIEEFSQEIDNLTRLYNDAVNNFEAAKRAENAANN